MVYNLKISNYKNIICNQLESKMHYLWLLVNRYGHDTETVIIAY